MEWIRWPPRCTLPPPTPLLEFVPAVAVRSQMSSLAPPPLPVPYAWRLSRPPPCLQDMSGRDERILNEGLEEEEDSERQHAFMLQQPRAEGDDRKTERWRMAERDGGHSSLCILHTHKKVRSGFFFPFSFISHWKKDKKQTNSPHVMDTQSGGGHVFKNSNTLVLWLRFKQLFSLPHIQTRARVHVDTSQGRLNGLESPLAVFNSDTCWAVVASQN